MTQRVYELDLLRFICALGVVIFHYTYTGHMEGFAPIADFEAVREVTRYTYVGINFFFVISGFVILMSLQGRTLREFLTARFIRLYPAYWAALTITALATLLWGKDVFNISLGQYLTNLTMAQELFSVASLDSAYWTLYIELKFYLCMVLLVACGLMPYLKAILTLVLSVSLLALFLPWSSNINMFVAMFPHWSGYFACGCVFYLVRRDGLNWQGAGLLVLSLAFMLTQSVLFGALMQSWFNIPFNGPTIALINGIFFALLCLTALAKRHPFRFRRWYYLGILTYPLYLLHQHLGYMLFNRFGNEHNIASLVVFTTLGMIVLAGLLHYGIEKPMARWLTQRTKSSVQPEQVANRASL
ncbi:acyltransferase family protein [Pseudoalteromonas rubra]|uniref:Acyltransferase family protein n=1 Tax=Pseudoalteromonas rubra TaxID=43658 RepID=A0A5S3UVJ3_9GAMM|nr:acyltransferase [Pseudoalteromonas rubra]QPB84232.1 acyltransferase family protein [Pseudoalteromonas rubra]